MAFWRTPKALLGPWKFHSNLTYKHMFVTLLIENPATCYYFIMCAILTWPHTSHTISVLLPLPDLRPWHGVDCLFEALPALAGRDFIGRPLLSISLFACFLMPITNRTICWKLNLLRSCDPTSLANVNFQSYTTTSEYTHLKCSWSASFESSLLLQSTQVCFCTDDILK